MSCYIGQIFQITPVPGNWTSEESVPHDPYLGQRGVAGQHRYPARQSEMVSRADAERRRHSAGPQGHVEESAATCLFLVSDEGGFITGQRIHVNDGAG